MTVLTGNNLNERHKEFNAKVNEAARNNDDFDKFKDTNENTDVDKFFKIDLAAKFKNIDYILEVLKSGDSLYVVRALKCDFLFTDEYLDFINPQYLELHILPSMSTTMKKKLFLTLAMHIKDNRAAEFHQYCMSKKMMDIGMKFLLRAHELFKIEILTKHQKVYDQFEKYLNYIENFVGNSFVLAELYLQVLSNHARSKILYRLRHLYSVSEEKYLNLLEHYQDMKTIERQCNSKLSRSIMKNHKHRVLKKTSTLFYLNILNDDMVAKYSNSDDAKIYVLALMPEHNYRFWNAHEHQKILFFLKLIPIGERFSFIRKTYTEKYSTKIFEEDSKFYTNSFYKLMSPQEQENLALRHIANGKELHGSGNDYIWYKFVNFEKAFVELKKYILITSDKDKRSNILEVLVDTAKTQSDIAKLLDYYYNRHNNEERDYKRKFIDQVIANNNVLDFNNECWQPLEKIFYSLDVFFKLSKDRKDFLNNPYRQLSLTYLIIHEKPIPEDLNHFVLNRAIKIDSDGEIDPTKKDMVFQYILTCYINHVQLLMKDKSVDLKDIHTYIHYCIDLITDFGKKLEELPKFIIDHIISHFNLFKHRTLVASLYTAAPSKINKSDIIHYLKTDASLVIANFPTIKDYFQRSHKRDWNWLINKLKIYFSHDIAVEFVKLLVECLSVEELLHLQTVQVAVYGIFNLCDHKYKIDFLRKYAPQHAKIDHVNISRNLLTIQTAICSVGCRSRPPLPPSSFRDYIKGDYMQYCIPIFYFYSANMTQSFCKDFVDTLLESPVSIRKHAIRLAFRCYDTENLVELIVKAWKSSKNVSLRKVLYKETCDKINDYDNTIAQFKLFGALKILTHDLNQNDDEDLFILFKLPSNVKGEHLQSLYTVVNTFPKKKTNYQRLTRIVEAIRRNVSIMAKTFLIDMTVDHINAMFEEKQKNSNWVEGYKGLINAKVGLISMLARPSND